MSILAALPSDMIGEPGLVALPSIAGQLCQTIIDSLLVGHWAAKDVQSEPNPHHLQTTVGKTLDVVPQAKADAEAENVVNSEVPSPTISAARALCPDFNLWSCCRW